MVFTLHQDGSNLTGTVEAAAAGWEAVARVPS